MKKTVVSLAALALLLVGGTVVGEEHHVHATLDSAPGSVVTGFVDVTQLPGGGSNLHVVARGLKEGTTYASFYYESSDCTADHDLLKSFVAGPGGVAEVFGKIDDDLDEVGSVSVRLGPDYGELQACAKIH